MKAILYALLAAVFYAINIPASKVLLRDVGPTTMASLLYLGAGIGIAILSLLNTHDRKASAPLTRRDMPFVVGMVVLALAAELVRRLQGYDTLKGVRRSFIPLAFSFYAYSAHWWTDTEGSLASAVEEMPAGYADKMVPIIQNTPILIVMLILTIPVALLGMRLAEKAMKKQAALLK